MAAAEATLEVIMATLDKNMKEQLEVIQTQRRANGFDDDEIGETELFVEQGQALGQTFKKLDSTQGRVGQVMLAALWKMSRENYFQLVFEAADAAEYVEDTRDSYKDYYYARSLAQVVDVVFTYIYARKEAGNPVLDTETQTEITVEHLIATEGLVSKLKEQAAYIGTLEKEADKDALISVISSGQSRTKVEAKRKTIEGGKTDPKLKIEGVESIDPDTKKTTVTMVLDQIKYDYVRQSVLIAEIEKDGENTIVSFNDMSEAEVKRLKRFLGETLTLHQKATDDE